MNNKKRQESKNLKENREMRKYGCPAGTNLWAGSRDDDVSRRLDPRLPVHLHRYGFAHREPDVVPLSNSNAGPQAALHLTLHVHTLRWSKGCVDFVCTVCDITRLTM